MFGFCGISRLFASPRHSAAPSATASTAARSDAPRASLGLKRDPAVTTVAVADSAHRASSVYSCATLDKPQARAAGRAPSRPRAAQLAYDGHSRRTSLQSHVTIESTTQTVRSAESVRPAPSRNKACALPLPVAVRTEQESGVQQYAAYMPCSSATVYANHIVIDGARYGRMGSEILRDALDDEDMLSLADASAALEHAPDKAKIQALRQKAQQLLRERAYEVIRHEFPEEFAKQTFRDNGIVTLYVPTAQREHSRSRDRRRHKYYVKLATPPVPPLPGTSAPNARGRATQPRCATPAFFSASGLSDA